MREEVQPTADRISGADGGPRQRRSPRPVPALAALLTAVSILLGAGLRLDAFLRRPALWLDELSIALNLVDRDLRGLTRPLELNQAAPIGWLWAEKASIKIFGTSEYALRLPALAAGILLLFATAVLARQLLPKAYAWLPVAVVALTPRLVEYSDELKPYSSDALLAVVVLSATVLVLRRPGWRLLGAWAVVALLGVAFSLPAILVAAASGLVLVVDAGVRGNRSRDLSSALTLAVALGAQLPWALLALWERRHLDPATVSGGGFWRPGFPTHLAGVVSWLPGAVSRLGVYFHLRPSWMVLPVVGISVLALLYVAYLRSRWVTALPLVVLVGATVAAAAVQAYPLMQRATLFLLPAIAIALGALPALAGTRSRRRLIVGEAASVAIVLVLGLTWLHANPNTGSGAYKVPAEPPLALVRDRIQPGDVVVIHAWVPRAYRWYGGQLGLPQGSIMVPSDGKPCSDRGAAARLAPARRMWVVAVDQPGSGGRLSQRSLFAAASGIGTVEEDHPFASGAHVILYRLKPVETVSATPHPGLCPLLVSRTPDPIAQRPPFWH